MPWQVSRKIQAVSQSSLTRIYIVEQQELADIVLAVCRPQQNVASRGLLCMHQHARQPVVLKQFSSHPTCAAAQDGLAQAPWDHAGTQAAECNQTSWEHASLRSSKSSMTTPGGGGGGMCLTAQRLAKGPSEPSAYVTRCLLTKICFNKHFRNICSCSQVEMGSLGCSVQRPPTATAGC